MLCEFCGETIQDVAVVCRFCGAQMEAGRWTRPPGAPAAAPGASGLTRFTFVSTGALLAISALLELASVMDSVVLAGALRSGLAAWAYHLVYAALFAGCGAGILLRRRWGYRAVLGATAFYTLDRGAYLLSRAGMDADILRLVDGHREFLDLVDAESLIDLTRTWTLLVVAGWWGFALYTHVRRSYFRS